MGLYKRGNTFWFSIMYHGRRIQESLETGNKRMAEMIYAKKLSDIVEGFAWISSATCLHVRIFMGYAPGASSFVCDVEVALFSIISIFPFQKIPKVGRG